MAECLLGDLRLEAHACPVPSVAPPTAAPGVKASAAYAGVCEKTIRNWIAAGLITGYRVGPKLIQCDLSEIDRIIRPVPAGGGDAA